MTNKPLSSIEEHYQPYLFDEEELSITHSFVELLNENSELKLQVFHLEAKLKRIQRLISGEYT